jgi:hypothetical protein
MVRFLSIELKFGGKTKITYLDFHLVVEEEITEFEISVNDSMGMKILYGVADLDDIALDLQLVESQGCLSVRVLIAFGPPLSTLRR